MGKAIVVTSGKGGVGKTTVSANIGYGLAFTGASVVLVDTDIGLRNLDVMMGLENKIVFNLVDVADGICELSQALIKDSRISSGLYLLPASQSKYKEDVSRGQMKAIVEALKKNFDYIVIDCPAGIEHGFTNAVQMADSAIVVVTPEVTSVRDADRVMGLLETYGITDVGLVVNRVRPEMVDRGTMLEVDEIREILGVKLVGVIPEDKNITACTNRGLPAILTKAPSARAFMAIAGRIAGSDEPVGNFGNKTFWGKLLEGFRR